MKIKQLFIIDPITKLNLEKDTSFLLINEAIKMEHFVSIAYDDTIFLENGTVYGKTHSFGSVFNQDFNFKTESLENFDVVHVRKDPPYDSEYLTLALILKHLKHPLVINNPEALLRLNEKESIFYFPELITETLISNNINEIRRFTKKVGGKVIIKPLFSCSGKGIVSANTSDVDEKFRAFSGRVMVQKFLDRIYEGETRVFILGNEPLAVMKKKPKDGSFLANFDFGATGSSYVLNNNEKDLCKKVGDFALRNGIHLSALDIIDGHLSEFNITSPGLLVETGEIMNYNYAVDVIIYLEQLLITKGYL